MSRTNHAIRIRQKLLSHGNLRIWKIKIKMQYDWKKHRQSHRRLRYPAWPVGYLTWPLRNEGQLGVTVSHSSVRPPVPPIRVAPYVSVFLWILGRVTHLLLPRHVCRRIVYTLHTCASLPSTEGKSPMTTTKTKIATTELPVTRVNEERRGLKL